MADKLSNGLFISELLADNAGGGAYDTDGDGGGNHSDEFVEIQNTTGSAVSLDGIEIWTEKNGLLYSFGAGDTIAAGGNATLVGQYDGAEPAGFFDAGLAEGDRLLQDGEGQKWDSVFLYDSYTNTYVVLSYGQPPRAPSLPTGFPSGAAQVGPGESINSNSPNGAAFARDTNGTLIETTPDPGTPDVVCFARGTHIDTPSGPRPVETFAPGDEITTQNGTKILRAVGRIKLSALTLKYLPNLRPIVFPKGSVGNTRRIVTSPNHRVAIRGSTLERYFGHERAFVAAKTLVGKGEIAVREKDDGITYYHLLFDEHEIVSLGGAWMESLYLSDMCGRAIAQMRDAGNWAGAGSGEMHHDKTALPCLKTVEADMLMKNMNHAPV